MTPEVYEVENEEIQVTDIIPEEQLVESQQIIANAVGDYLKLCESMSIEEWVPKYLKNQYNNMSDEEAEVLSSELISSLKETEEANISLHEAKEKGISREHWLGKRIEESTSGMTEDESKIYLKSISDSVNDINSKINNTLPVKVESSDIIFQAEDSFDKKFVSYRFAEEVEKTAFFGAKIETETSLLKKLKDGEEIYVEDIARAGGKAAIDFGIKTATAAGIRTAAEFGALKTLKSQPSSLYTGIAFIGVENMKTAVKVARGEISSREGIDRMQDSTCSAVGGIIASTVAKNSVSVIAAKIGAMFGSAFGPAGTAVGAVAGKVTCLVAGSAVYALGSKAGETLSHGFRMMRSAVCDFFGRSSVSSRRFRRRSFERFY